MKDTTSAQSSQALKRAVSALSAKKFDEAEQLCNSVLSENPNVFEAVYLLGVVQSSLGKNELALASYDKALALRPDFAEANYNRGNVLKKLNRLDEALASYERTIALQPGYAKAFSNRGNTLAELKRFEEALVSYDRALVLQPNLVEALYNRGNALYALKRFDEALGSYDRAVAVQPKHAKAIYNRANTLAKMQRFDEALVNYNQVIALDPGYAEALYNRGNTLRELKRFNDALDSYSRAISIRGDDGNSFSNRGVTLHELGRFDEAVADFDRALGLRADDPDILCNRGNALVELKRFDDALASYDRALTIDKAHPYALSGLAFTANNMCDWDRRAFLLETIKEHVTEGRSIVSPFVVIGYSDDPALQLQCAKNYVSHTVPSCPKPLWSGEKWRHQKLRVAYLSADFHSHPTASLMAELFELHDRSRFEIVGVSFGKDDRSEMRRRLAAAFDVFQDVRERSDSEIANYLRKSEVDIAIDLKGYTLGARPGILAKRPAPIQVNYLGYPGTMGASFIDYIIADPVILPFDQQQFYTEKIVQLPDSYQPNDSKRKASDRLPSRQSLGLPEGAFVFCCFNNNWKISPEVFDVWMRLLMQVEKSVLWLLSDNAVAERNLCKEAERRGIAAARVVFARRVPIEEHLARHRFADLFLDTSPCNAHTTGSDALWTGLPVLTCKGDAFAGRVAASLLRASGMPELVVENLKEYETRALQIARNPGILADLKGKIERHRSAYPLFDSKSFVSNIEAAYTQMSEIWQRGERPRNFLVERADNSQL